MTPELVLFAVEAGIKLGKKINDVIVDETFEKGIFLPELTTIGNADVNRAIDYFMREENASILNMSTASDSDILLAYSAAMGFDNTLQGTPGTIHGAAEINKGLVLYRQFAANEGAKPALRRVFGTVVEIGIDYFAANPEALGEDSNARKILQAFVNELQDVEFAEGERHEILGDLLKSALKILNENTTFVDDSERTQALLGGVTDALIKDIDAMTSVGKQIAREDLFKRIGSSVLRGAAGAFTEHIDAFLPEDGSRRKLVGETLTSVLEGIKGKENLFTNESIELIVRSALGAVGENAEVFSRNPFIQDLISQTIKAATDAQGRKLFSGEAVAGIVQAALVVIGENVDTLLDPDNPQDQLLAKVTSAIAGSLAGTVAGGGTAREMLSKAELLGLVRVAFEEVAERPELLFDNDANDPRKTALAQVIGSVTAALGEDPGRFVSGRGFIDLVRIAGRTTVLNLDKLVDFDTTTPTQNLLYKILRQITQVITEDGDPRWLISRGGFLDIAGRSIPLVSANLELIVSRDEELVGKTLRTVLALAKGALDNRINGENLPALFEEMLRRVLWDEFTLDGPATAKAEALTILRHAA